MTDPTARPRQVALIRLTSLGDVIHTLPIAAAIRAARPADRIVWLVEAREAIILRDNPVVDEVIVVPLREWREDLSRPGGWRRSARALRALIRSLREMRIDAAIDVQGWPQKTSPLALAMRAPMRIGFDRRHVRHPLALLFTNTRVTPPAEAKHVVEQNLALLGPLGIPSTGDPQFPLPPFQSAQLVADAWLRDHGVRDRERLVALLPSTRGRAKLWPAERYRECARHLLTDPAARVIVLGGPGEEAVLNEVCRELPPDRAWAWAPGPIPQLAAILRRVDMAIGNDTGPLHIAAANGVPSVGLFGPTRGERNGPYGSHCAFVQSPTRRMTAIGVDEVIAVADRLPRRSPATTTSAR